MLLMSYLLEGFYSLAWLAFSAEKDMELSACSGSFLGEGLSVGYPSC